MVERERVAEYSISGVSKLTGIGCHALRVWERRYGVPAPNRSPSGHRRYGADQVRTVAAVARKLREGESLHVVMDQVRSGTLDLREEIATADASRWASVVDALIGGDTHAAEAAHRIAVDGLAPADRVSLVVEPALIEVGERWFRRDCDIGQEHYATGFLRRVLSRLLDGAQEANTRPKRLALVGTPQGERHEGGAMIVCILLELAGWRALSMGCDIPVREFQKAVDRWRPDAVCLSFALSRNINKRFAELARIRGAPVFVGGRSLLNYQGLARRHGLCPLVGRGVDAVPKMIARLEEASGDQRAS